MRYLTPVPSAAILTADVQRRALLAGLLAGVLVAGCRKAVRLSAIPPGQTVLAFGDSVTYGTGAARGEDWPSLLAQKTGWTIVNAGIPGDTAHNGKGRIQALLDEHRPVLVILEIGGNDFLRRAAPKSVKVDIRQLIKTSLQSGAQVALVAVPELSVMGIVAGRPSDSPIYAELADEEKVPLVPNVFSDTLARPELCADRIHPNAQGYQHMATGIHARLQALGWVP
ncbi:MAG: GDSL-type esterase/lipase family protein [Pseudomonadota bacterium]